MCVAAPAAAVACGSWSWEGRVAKAWRHALRAAVAPCGGVGGTKTEAVLLALPGAAAVRSCGLVRTPVLDSAAGGSRVTWGGKGWEARVLLWLAARCAATTVWEGACSCCDCNCGVGGTVGRLLGRVCELDVVLKGGARLAAEAGRVRCSTALPVEWPMVVRGVGAEMLPWLCPVAEVGRDKGAALVLEVAVAATAAAAAASWVLGASACALHGRAGGACALRVAAKQADWAALGVALRDAPSVLAAPTPAPACACACA